MKTETRVWFFIALLILVSCVLLVAPAWAWEKNKDPNVRTNTRVDTTVNTKVGGDTINGGTFTGGDMIGGTQTTTTGAVDMTVGGDKNRAYALAPPGLGDVDIAQCLGSEAWTLLVGGKQKLVLNQVCMAEFYLKQGRYDLAAQALCNQPEIVAEYESEQACEADHYFEPAEPVAYMAEAPVDDDDEDDLKRYEAEIAALAERLKASEIKAKDAQRVAYNAQKEAKKHPEEYTLSEEQIAELEEWEQRWVK